MVHFDIYIVLCIQMNTLLFEKFFYSIKIDVRGNDRKKLQINKEFDGM